LLWGAGETGRNALVAFLGEGPNSLKEKHLRTTFRLYTFGIGAKNFIAAIYHTCAQLPLPAET